MASARIVLFKGKKNKDEKHLTALRITHDRKPAFLFFDWIHEKDWDAKQSKVKKSHPNANRLNQFMLKKLVEANDTIIQYQTDSKQFTSKEIVQLLKNDAPEKNDDSFFNYADQYIIQLYKENKYNRAIPDKSRIALFKKFMKGSDIPFSEINQSLLRKFQTFVLSEKEGKASLRSVMNTYVVIRTLFNRAIGEGLVDKNLYPFGKGKIQIKFPESIKIGLDKTEIEKIESLNLEAESTIWHTRNVFLFSYYLAGIRISDVLRIKWADIFDDRIVYRMGKNNKVDSLKLPEKVKVLLENYKNDNKGNFVFPELNLADQNDLKDMYAKTKTAVKKFNKYLKEIAKLAEINKKVTCHIARHTFGNIAGDKISPQMLQKLYRHSNLTTTIGYQGNFIHTDVDEALDNVLNS